MNEMVATVNAGEWVIKHGTCTHSAFLGRLNEGMPMDRPLEVSIPLCEANGSLARTARGAGDRAYATLFRALAAARPGDPEIWIRPGWGM